MLYLLQASRLVEHSDQVMFHLRTIEKQMLDMQTSFRGFRLTGDPVYLAGYEAGIDAGGIPAKLDALEQLVLVKNNPGHRAIVRELRGQMQSWFDLAEEELRAVRRNPGETRSSTGRR